MVTVPPPGLDATRAFFDDMAPRYDTDLDAVGWAPLRLVDGWPFVVPPLASVLDAGCGTGLVLERLAGAGRVLSGFDLSPGMLARARRRRGLREADLRVASAGGAWPFPDAHFDRVLALAMLEFVPALDVALDELARVLRPHGRALCTVEDVASFDGAALGPFELRYDAFPLWRRSREELELCVPPSLDIVRWERVAGYTELDQGFTCAYWVVELARCG